MTFFDQVLLKTADALLHIHNAPRGSRFAVYIRCDAPVPEKGENVVFSDALSSHLTITRKEALRIVSDMLSRALEDRGARIPIQCTETKNYKTGKMIKTYWIG